MAKLFTSDVFGVKELCAASGNRPAQLEGYCRFGIVHPYKDSHGLGTRKVFKGAITILDATEARELTRAGFSHRQILRRFTVQREALAGLSPKAALVARFRFYIATITQLGDMFGRGPGYGAWLATQQAQLKRMERALANAPTGTPENGRVLNLLAAAVPAEDEPPALAG